MCRILLVNEGFSDNLGDQAIRESAEYILGDLGCVVEFSDYTRTVSAPIKISREKKNGKLPVVFKSILPIKVRWCLKNIFRIVRQVKGNYDIVVIGGGQLLAPNSKFTMALFVWTMAIKWFSKSKIYLIGIGAEGGFVGIEKILISTALNHIDLIAVRDKESQEIVDTIVNKKVFLVHDFAFLISKIYKQVSVEPSHTKEVLLNIPTIKVYRRFHGSKATLTEYYKIWREIFLKYYNSGYSVKLFYTTQKDMEEAYGLAKYLFTNLKISPEIVNIRTLAELINFIQGADVIVSGRMHASILALVYGKQIDPYFISEKITSFYSQYGKEPSISKIQDELIRSIYGIFGANIKA